MIMPVALAVMIGVSLLSPLQIRRISVLGFAATLVLLAVVPLAGHEIKGATRWVSVAGVSMQPSEFAKPFFAVVTAWMFASSEERRVGQECVRTCRSRGSAY